MYEYFNETYTVTDGKTTFQFSVSYDLSKFQYGTQYTTVF